MSDEDDWSNQETTRCFLGGILRHNPQEVCRQTTIVSSYSSIASFIIFLLFRLIAIFNEQELELLLSGLPDINIDDLKANSEYHKYSATSLQIVW